MSTDWGHLEHTSLAWVNYIEAEMERVLRPDWKWERIACDWRRDPPRHLSDVEWCIREVPAKGGEAYYRLYTSPDGRMLLLSYGNTDAGPVPHLWRQAAVMDIEHLHYAPLGRMLQSVVGHLPPDRYGLT